MFRLFIFLSIIFSFSFGNIIVDKKELDDFDISYYYDKSKNLSIEEISKIKFEKTIKNQFAFSYLKGNSWFKFKITNKTDTNRLILHFVEPFFETLEIYENKDGSWLKKQSGLFKELEQRDMYDISPVFILNIKPNQTKTFYIKAYTKFSQFGKFKIYTKKESVTKYRLFINTLYIFFFGSLFIMIVFNSFLYVTLKEKIYFYYVNYIVFFSGFIIGFSGLTIYLGLALYHYTIHLVFIPMTMVFLILFSIKFLDIKKNLPITYKVLIVLILANLFVMIMSYFKFDPWYRYLTLLASITYIVLLYMAVRSWVIGHLQAKYYLFAMSIYIFTIIIMSLMINGVLENNHITRYAFLYGSFIEIVVFSLLLAHRFYDIQNEKIKIQNELIQIKDKNKEFLEKEIDNRTKKIKGLLDDKEFLLKEVYHRVKNNFQLIVSLLVLEKNKNIKQKDSYIVLINRIKSMSNIHQSLYETDTISKIDSIEYISKTIDDVTKAYEKNNIKIVKDIESLSIDANNALALGIVINEVLTNAIKHNIDNENLNIEISFKYENKKMQLTIKDNGKGFEFENINTKNSLGIKLIEQFVKKLNNGTFKYSYKLGTIFKLTFN